MYLPSFYKLQFEKYLFNSKRAGMFMIPVVLWSKQFNLFQLDGHSILIFITLSILTFSHQPEVLKEEFCKNNENDCS